MLINEKDEPVSGEGSAVAVAEEEKPVGEGVEPAETARLKKALVDLF